MRKIILHNRASFGYNLPRLTAIGERAAATRALAAKVKELLAALLPIDRLIIQYQTTPAGEAFVAAYFAARTIYDRGHGPGEDDPAPPPAPPTP